MAHTHLFRKFVLLLQAARREHLQLTHRPAPISMHDMEGWNRRKFMKTSLMASVAGLASSSLITPVFADDQNNTTRVAIIGAGIAGLNAAYHLKSMGVNAQIYEARARVGGRIFSSTIENGLVLDIGAELINTDHIDMLTLAKHFNIELFNKLQDAKEQAFPEEIYLFDGIRYNEDNLVEDLKMIAQQIGNDARMLYQNWSKYAPIFDRLSVADYLAHHQDKMPDSYIHELIAMALRTEYGAELHESSALQLLFLLPEVNGQAVNLLSYSDEAYAVVGGSAKITDALSQALEGQIQLNTALHSIEQVGKEYRLNFSNKPQVMADIVIVTIPFPALRNVRLNVPLPELFMRFIKETGLGANEKVLSGFSERFWRQANGFSLAAWTDLGFAEVWDETQRQPDHTPGVLNFFLGGDQARQLGKVSNISTLCNQFITKLDEFIPGAIASSTGNHLKSSWTTNTFTGGGYANFKPGQLTTFGEYFWVESANKGEQQTVSFDNLIFAGEHLSDAYYGFMEGGAQTGRLAATHAWAKIQTCC